MDSFNLTTAVTKASTETLSFKSPVFFKRKFNVFNLPSRSATCLLMIPTRSWQGRHCRKREKAVPRFLINSRFIHLI